MGAKQSRSKKEWEETIKGILKRNIDTYNAKDFHRLAQDFSVNAHRLPAKLPLTIGREAIEEQYRNFSDAPLNEIELTHLPYYSDDAAVFEFTGSVKGVGVTYKGVGLVVMEGGQPKMATFAFNYDQ